MNLLLDIEKSQYGEKIIETASVGETLLFGGKMVLIGMLTIFTVLCLILFCLSIFKYVFRKKSKNDEAAAKVEESESVVAAPVVQASNDQEIIAVIAAAIAAAEAESANGAKFRVVSFRRK